jgi:hypothetical protein
MKKIVAVAVMALALAGCAGDPVWNTAVFPQQPEYGMTPAAPAVAQAPK